MSKLTKRQESFIGMMKQNEELALKGFRLLLERPDFPHYFDALNDAGLFAPQNNPGPAAGERENTVRIPFWAPLDYLKALADYAAKEHAEKRATQLLNIIRAVSTWRDETNHLRRNYHTNRVFAQILGILPTSIINLSDIDLIREWVNDPYERMLVTDAIDQGLLPRLLASESPDDWEKAAGILRHMTAIRWHNDADGKEPEPVTVVDDYWLKRLVDHHATMIGIKARATAAKSMLERVREVFNTPLRREHSSVFRPAIEAHVQNHQWRSAENRTVDALRDVLDGWAQAAPNDAKGIVKEMLADDLQIIRRVAIYVLTQHWTTMKDLYTSLLQPALFSNGHNHELYHLLQTQFANMEPHQQQSILDTMRKLPLPTYGDNPETTRKQQQFRWLSAIKGQNSKAAEQWFAELEKDPSVGKVGAHPDFDSYFTIWEGPGASPYSPEELAALATANLIVDKLNSFQAEPAVYGATTDGLTSALASAAQRSPQVFLDTLPEFRAARLEYQHAVINGLKQAWEAADTTADWDRGWEQLMTYFEQTIADEAFWQRTADQYQHWVVTMIAEVLHAGTQNDEHAYRPALLKRAQDAIDQLLIREPPATTASDDAMSQSINTPKGRIVEALFSHAMRAARVSDKTEGNHTSSWLGLQPIFERELKACKNTNFEFNTLCGAYLPQLQYLDAAWADAHVEQIFPIAYETNTLCALDGLAYSAFTRPLYEVLAKHGVFDRALSLPLRGKHARGKLLERLAGAYLWGIEPLDGHRFEYIFQNASTADIDTIAWVLWTVRNDKLTADHRERIVAFWERAIAWAIQQQPPAEQTLSKLSLLAAHLTTVGRREQELLEAVAPHVGTDHNHFEFVDELLRLAPDNYASIAVILEKMLSSRVPDYDYEGRLRQLLELLALNGHRESVLLQAERLRHLPSIQELYNKLTNQP